MPTMKNKLDSFLKLCTYISGQYDQASDYQRLEKHIEDIEQANYPEGPKNRLFYMALPPSVFIDVAKGLKENCYTQQGINRIVVEKPFGKDLESSREMMGKLKALWQEHEVKCVLLTATPSRLTDGAGRLSASTTTSARKWSRTFSCFASQTACSTRASTRTSCPTCKSPSRNPLAPKAEVATLTSLESSGTLCRTVRAIVSSFL
jgi:hypothetical protein